jgi:hypothetical protein
LQGGGYGFKSRGLHLYGINRDDVAYIMDTFKVVREKDEKSHGEYRTKRLILERYDALADATRTGRPYRSPLDPAPAAAGATLVDHPRPAWSDVGELDDRFVSSLPAVACLPTAASGDLIDGRV